MSKVLLLDGFFLLHRANIKFGKPSPVSDKPDFNLVFVFFRSLRVLVEQFQPDKIFFCLEGANNYRYKLYSKYKANRLIKQASSKIEKTEDFNRQKNIVLELLEYLPVSKILAQNYEADDIIGTLVDTLIDEELIIVSGDSDFLQLLQRGNPRLRFFNPIKKEFQTAPEFHYLVFKSLVGDVSDNIPKLLEEEQALHLLTHPQEFESFLSVQENRDNFDLNRKLVEIRTVPDNELIIQDFNLNFPLLKSKFEEMDFLNIIADKYWTKFQATFNCCINNS